MDDQMKQPTTLLEALELTLETLGDLKASGIDVMLTPSRGRQNKETVDKYDRPDRLKPCWWLHATMKPADKAQGSKIFEEAENLRRYGIGFDTGGGMGCRDWELDWSFRLGCANSADLESMSEGREVVEDILDKQDL